MRVLEPVQLDFVAIGDGMIRNNVGVDAISLEVRVRVEDERVLLQPTGQSFPLVGEAPGEGWALLAVERWDDPALTTVSVRSPPPVADPPTP